MLVKEEEEGLKKKKNNLAGKGEKQKRRNPQNDFLLFLGVHKFILFQKYVIN